MAKKKAKKQVKKEESQVKAQVDIQEEVVAEEKVEESKPEVKVEKKEPKVKKAPVKSGVSLKDAARRYVIGYKEYWLPSISKFAESQGISGDMSIEEAKSVLRKWGAKVK